MKLTYEVPEIEVIEFQTTDQITGSGNLEDLGGGGEIQFSGWD